jgi:hypothetical protein
MVTGQSIPVGSDVFTSDGDKLGQVAEVRGSAFRVDVSMMPDYWLPADCVETSDTTGVRLECSKDEVGDHKVDAPAAM